MISKKKLALMAMMVMSLGVTSASLAANPVTTGNPYGLVYANAITHNEKGQVNIHPVHYDLDGRTIAANVYTPKNYDPAKSYAAVVVAHPNGGVKEQVAGLYAQKLAEAGYVTIAADASFQVPAAANRVIRICRTSGPKISTAWSTISASIPASTRTASGPWASAVAADTR